MFMLNSTSFFVAAATFSCRIMMLFYSDPGSGAMLWQMIAAFFVGGLFYVTFAYNKMKTFALKALGLTDGKDDLTKNNSFDGEKLLEH